MLADCLASLNRLVPSMSVFPTIVVVDNNPSPEMEGLVSNFRDKSIYPVNYRHQPVKGIASARNTALEAAIALGVKWVAFIDDDEQADEDWLSKLMCPGYRDTPILVGRNVPVYPLGQPFWIPAKPHSSALQEGKVMRTAVTGNVRFSMDIVLEGLRFDDTLNLSGGEDNEFFALAAAKGYGIKQTLRAITYETVLPDRTTYKALVYRSLWCAASEYRRLALTRGHWGAMRRRLHKVPINLITAALWLSLAALAYPFSTDTYRSMAIRGGRTLAKGAGTLAAMFKIKPQPYANVSGY